MEENIQLILKGSRMATHTLAPYIYTQFKNAYGDAWWDKGVKKKVKYKPLTIRP